MRMQSLHPHFFLFVIACTNYFLSVLDIYSVGWWSIEPYSLHVIYYIVLSGIAFLYIQYLSGVILIKGYIQCDICK